MHVEFENILNSKAIISLYPSQQKYECRLLFINNLCVKEVQSVSYFRFQIVAVDEEFLSSHSDGRENISKILVQLMMVEVELD